MKKGFIEENSISLSYQSFQHDLFLLSFINLEVPNLVNQSIQSYKTKMIEKFDTSDTADGKDFAKLMHFLDETERRKKSKRKNFLKVEVESERVQEVLPTLMMLNNLLAHAPRFIREMSIVSLVSSFEDLLSNVIRTYYLDNSKALISDKQLSYKEILTCNDMDELKKKLIEREISNLLNLNIDEICKWLKKRFRLKLDEETKWLPFKERFYRRNIIIHNNGYPDKVYAEKTGNKNREKVSVNQGYLEESFELFGLYCKIIRNHFFDKRFNIRIKSDVIE